jgi:hypothetical protein
MTITRNIVGLARFLFFILSPRIKLTKRAEKRSDKEAQLEKHIGPTVSLKDKQPVFCSKCHTLICWKAKDNGDTVVVDIHGNILHVSGITIIDKDGKRDGFSMMCPNGHREVVKCKV